MIVKDTLVLYYAHLPNLNKPETMVYPGTKSIIVNWLGEITITPYEQDNHQDWCTMVGFYTCRFDKRSK
ncbi:unnamed protein product [Oppiella nova]|uniref:Uncharacterized protein n=1 Tax=Oppiella nova TaxID=334625 RepID=A0A7R9LXZ9_9ACAR|nr:unnamed protein product [Oppiella nova]CAG2168005.1 unnamed protein product [Oppiella nova]